MKFRRPHPIRPLALILALVGMSALNEQLHADLISFEANLTGLEEVPPNASPGFGTADLTLDTTTELVTITSGSFSDLLGGVTGITFNGPTAAGSNAAVLINFPLGDTAGLTSGTFTGSGNLADVPTANSMIAGDTYLNIRSQVFPSGEIRGQVIAAPEPAGVVLLGIAMLICGAIYAWPVSFGRRDS